MSDVGAGFSRSGLPISSPPMSRAPSSPTRPLRWGFLSTARIGRKYWEAMLRSGNNVVTAVASRDVTRAQQFIDDNQRAAPMPSAPRAFGSYEELLTCADIDAVYLPVPTGLRAEWVLNAARAGKHVLAEKPAACSADQLAEELAVCREHGVQFMDGVMFMHHPRLAHLGELLHTHQALGELRRVDSAFTFAGGDDFTARNIRAQAALEPHGCLGDLGWYCLRLSLWAMNWQMPVRARGVIHTSHGGASVHDGVPMEFSGEIEYANGASCGFFCSFRSPTQQWAHVSGTKGLLRLDDFVHATLDDTARYFLNGGEVRSPVDPALEPAAHDVMMVRRFARQVAAGRLNEDWPRWSLLTQLALDACYASARRQGAPVEINPPA